MSSIFQTLESQPDQLLDQLQNEDIRLRIASLKEILTIASSLGEQRTLNELLPFLHELLDDEDEVLLELSLAILRLIDQLGNAQNSLYFLSLLEILSKAEESSVRENGLLKVIKNIDITTSQEIFQELIKQYLESEQFMGLTSLAFIIPHIFKDSSVLIQQELLNIFSSLVTNDIPQVRKGASQHFKYFPALHPLVDEAYLIQQVTLFLQDDQDFVRLYQTDTLIEFSKLTLESYPEFQQSMCKLISEDSSWRVRFYFIDKLHLIAKAYGKEFFNQQLFPQIILGLQDQEPELRSISALRIQQNIDFIEQFQAEQLLQNLQSIIHDKFTFVRNSVASSLLILCSKITIEKTEEYILPLFLEMLQDIDSEVKITLFKNFSFISSVLGQENLAKSTIPALNKLSQDKNFRIRIQTLGVLDFFAKSIGPSFLNEDILKIIIYWLTDKVFAVREATLQQLKNLTTILGIEWSENLEQNTNYLLRQSVLFSISTLKQNFSESFIAKSVIPVIERLKNDKVVNIRLHLINIIDELYKCVNEDNKEKLKNILITLADDHDQEVKDLAQLTLNIIS